MNHDLLLLDTGPIRELVKYQVVHTLGFEKLRRDLEFFLDSSAFDRFGRFLAPFRQKVTTTSVIVELYHWVRKTDPPGRARIWSLIYDEFTRMGIKEHTVKLLEMRTEIVARCGPTDCSLLHL